jgi:hypothetical protein
MRPPLRLRGRVLVRSDLPARAKRRQRLSFGMFIRTSAGALIALSDFQSENQPNVDCETA